MRSHVTKTVCACFAVLRHISAAKCPSVRYHCRRWWRLLSWLDGLPKRNPRWHSVISAKATSVGDELCCSAGVLVVAVRRHSTSPPTALVEGTTADWFPARSPCLQVSVYGAVASYLDELNQPQLADFEARHRLRSASSPSLLVRRTRLSTIGDRAFPVVTAARVWNSLPQHVTSVFRSCLKTHLFMRCFHWLYQP